MLGVAKLSCDVDCTRVVEMAAQSIVFLESAPAEIADDFVFPARNLTHKVCTRKLANSKAARD